MELTIASLFGRSACGVAFDDEEFAGLRVIGLAIGKFSRKRPNGERIFALYGCTGAFSGHACFHCVLCTGNDGASRFGMLFEKAKEFRKHEFGDRPQNGSVREFPFRLTGKIWRGKFYSNGRVPSFAYIGIVEWFFDKTVFQCILVDDSEISRFETLFVGSPVRSTNRVGKRSDFATLGIPNIHGDLYFDVSFRSFFFSLTDDWVDQGGSFWCE